MLLFVTCLLGFLCWERLLLDTLHASLWLLIAALKSNEPFLLDANFR